MSKKVAKNKIQKFSFADIARSEISTAEYNPRSIDEASADKLQGVLEDDDIGLVEPLVFNKRTGRLVGGHQRLARMDAIHADVGDYLVPVSVIDVDEQVERRINLVLNNHGLQGTWDVEKLEAMFKTDTDPFTAGFDFLDMQNLFDNATVLELVDKYYPDIRNGGNENMPGDTDQEHLADTESEIAKIKEARSEHKAADRESLRSDHIVVVVFETADEATKALNALKLDPTETFVFAPKFLAAAKERAAAAYEVVTTKKV